MIQHSFQFIDTLFAEVKKKKITKQKKKRHQIRSSIMMVYVMHSIGLLLIWCRYQAPIPADQVKSWTEYDYEGRKATGSDYYCNTFLGI